MDAWFGFNESTSTYDGTLATSPKWKERFKYDGNGNIQHADRYYNDAYSPMDSLDYHYTAGTNKLTHVTEASTSYSWVNGSNDIETQPTGNYGYDAIGNLIKDSSENIAAGGIIWNVYGKIASIIRSSASATSDTRRIDYTYDVAGNRISKVEYTWYVRDAQGNVLNVYSAARDTGLGITLASFDLNLLESHLYGSSRIGIYNRDVYAEPPSPRGAQYDFYRRHKFYEISNHLGNVLTTISDRKFGVVDPSNSTRYAYYTPEITMANDYYVFGMERKHYDGGIYYSRYGFNGKENDRDVKGEGNQQDYGMRIYDPRLGRFLSIDPVTNKYPELTPYQFASNRPIDGIDLDGKEYAEGYVFYKIFIEPFVDFNNGAQKLMQGTAQVGLAQAGQADYQNSDIPDHVQKMLEKKDKIEGATKMITGTTKMVVATADVVMTYVPMTTEVALLEKTASKVPVGRYIMKEVANEVPKPTSFGNWGEEFIDDLFRIKEQPYTPPQHFSGRSIIVDENLSPQIAKQLQESGYNVKTFPKGTSDADIIASAKRENSIVLTNNIKDFKGMGVTTFEVSQSLTPRTAISELVKRIGKVSASVKTNSSLVTPGQNIKLIQY